jgi:NADP-dependent 3-hydroxy acid dehydrogenase YdfG
MTISDYRSALVTGASAGIGAEVVRALRARGIAVTALARRADRLETLAEQTGCTPLALDLMDTPAVEAAMAELAPDIVVNNAGSGVPPGPLYEMTAEQVDRVIDVNLRAATHVLRTAAKSMAARDRGHIVNVTSLGALAIFSNMSVYNAAKTGLRVLGQVLRNELYGKHVRVSEIAPGRVATEFLEQATGDAELAHKFYTEVEPLQAKDVADAILYVLDAPAHVNVNLIDIVPTLQVAGGLRFASKDG